MEYGIVDKVVSQDFPQKTVVADVRLLNSLQAALKDYSILINLAA